MKPQKAVIIGGGVIGAFIAYSLLHKGWPVTILEKGRFGSGCSEGNCGLIVPNHVLPLNSFGTLLKAFRSMLTRDAPLHVKPQFDPDLFQWFIKFALKCRPRDILFSARGRHALLQSSFGLYPSILEKEGLDCDWEMGGSVHAFRSEKEWQAYAEEVNFIRKIGITVEKLDRDQLQRLEPSLSPDLCGGWFYPHTAQLRPEKLLTAMHGLLTQQGATILENTEVTGFESSNAHAKGVRTADATLSADMFVVAAGAWAPRLQKELDCRLPIQPGKGYSTTMADVEQVPALPCFFEEKSVVATSWPDAFRLGGTMEFSGFDDSLNPQRLSSLARGAKQYLAEPSPDNVEKEWCGFRPMTSDGLPIIDRSPRFHNVIIAAGHNMLGLSMAPATGRLVSEIISQETPHVDPRPYGLQRFS